MLLEGIMRRGNWQVIFVTFAAMAVGVMVPGVGARLPHLATVCLMTQLLLAFLATGVPGAGFTRETFKGLPLFLAFSLLAAPAICGLIFWLFMPSFALGAILVSGSAVGVMSPFFGMLLRADNPFIIAAVIISSLLLPLTMPFLVLGYLYLSGQEAAGGLWLAFAQTAVALGIYIIVPFVVSKLLWGFRAGLAERVLNRRYSITLVCVGTSMFIIFSQFAEPLRANPGMVLTALIGALGLSVVLIAIGVGAGPAGVGSSVERKLGCAISMGTRNNVLMVIIAAQFFGLPEVLVAAMYSVPLNLLLVPYTWYARRLRGKEGRM